MAKFSIERKIRAVREYLAGQESIRQVAKRHTVNKQVLHHWIECYRHHGEDGLRKRYTNYIPEYKMDVLNFMNDTGASPSEAAAVFDIPSKSTVANWKVALDQIGPEALILKKKGPPSMILKLLKAIGLTCRVWMKKYRSYRGNIGKVALNVLSRDFTAEKPNQKWVTDVTEFALFGQKLYLSPVLDLFNSEIIAYTIQSRPTYDLVSTMLEQAFEQLDPEDELVLHSDQGWHYQMEKYQTALVNRNITQSMSRKGNCLDNAVIENFFGILKTELLYLKEFESVKHFRQELDDYMDYYNQKRMKRKLKNMSPVEYRTHVQQAA